MLFVLARVLRAILFGRLKNMSSNNDSSSCRVWSRFEAKRKDGSVLKLRIQEAPKDLFDEIMEFNIKYFTSGEHIQKSAGLASNPASLAEYKSVSKEVAKSWSISICCEDNESKSINKILGVSSVHLSRGEQLSSSGFQFQTKEIKKLFEIFMDLEKLYKPSFDVYYSGRGITVHPEYRGLGIATEFVKVRRLEINEKNIPMTCAWMTSYGSQKAAQKDNWETTFEITTEEFGKRYDLVMEDAPLTFKFMLAKNSRENE